MNLEIPICYTRLIFLVINILFIYIYIYENLNQLFDKVDLLHSIIRFNNRSPNNKSVLITETRGGEVTQQKRNSAAKAVKC